MITVPTLLTTTKEELSAQIQLFQKYYKRIQLDIADGLLVPNKTVQIEEIIDLITDNRKLIPKNLVFDFHLMVKDFASELEKIAQIKAKNINVNAVLINFENGPDVATLEGKYNFTIGLDIFPSTQIGDLAREYDLSKIRHIQIMTVNPGFQGSPFLPEMLNKIQQLRDSFYSKEILIDGGVNSKTLPIINSKEKKPDVICIGSYLTKAGSDLGHRVEELQLLEK